MKKDIKKNENDMIEDILNEIKIRKRYISNEEFYDIILQLGYWKIFRMNRRLLLDYLNRHNSYFLFRPLS